MIFDKSEAEGYFLNRSSRTSTIYIKEICHICGEFLADKTVVLRGKNIVICEKCAYNIHAAYEANL